MNDTVHQAIESPWVKILTLLLVAALCGIASINMAKMMDQEETTDKLLDGQQDIQLSITRMDERQTELRSDVKRIDMAQKRVIKDVSRHEYQILQLQKEVCP